MKKLNCVREIVLMAVVLLCSVGCDSLEPTTTFTTWLEGWADLTVTNITTGDVVQKNFNGSIIINGEEIKYEIIAKGGDEIEVLYSLPKDKADKSFAVEFEILGKTVKAPDVPPYKVSYVVDNDIAKGKYAIKCRTFCKSLGYGETQSIDIVVE